MTCEEFMKLSERDPFSCTVAERAGHYVHWLKCRTCRLALEAEALSRGPLAVSEMIAISDQFVSDMNDPEARAQCARAYKEFIESNR